MKRGREKNSYFYIVYSDDVCGTQKGPSKRIRSPRRRRRSYIHNTMYVKEPFVIVSAAAKSCPVRNGIDLLKVGTSFVRVPGSIPAGIASRTFGRNAKKKREKKKRFNAHKTRARARSYNSHPCPRLIGRSPEESPPPRLSEF